MLYRCHIKHLCNICLVIYHPQRSITPVLYVVSTLHTTPSCNDTLRVQGTRSLRPACNATHKIQTWLVRVICTSGLVSGQEKLYEVWKCYASVHCRMFLDRTSFWEKKRTSMILTTPQTLGECIIDTSIIMDVNFTTMLHSPLQNYCPRPQL